MIVIGKSSGPTRKSADRVPVTKMYVCVCVGRLLQLRAAPVQKLLSERSQVVKPSVKPYARASSNNNKTSARFSSRPASAITYQDAMNLLDPNGYGMYDT